MSTHIISNYGRLSEAKQRQIVADILQLLVCISSLSLSLSSTHFILLYSICLSAAVLKGK